MQVEQLRHRKEKSSRLIVTKRLAASAFYALGSVCSVNNAVKIQDDPGMLDAIFPDNNRVGDYLIGHQPSVVVASAFAGAFLFALSSHRLSEAASIIKLRVRNFRDTPGPLVTGLGRIDRIDRRPLAPPRRNSEGVLVSSKKRRALVKEAEDPESEMPGALDDLYTECQNNTSSFQPEGTARDAKQLDAIVARVVPAGEPYQGHMVVGPDGTPAIVDVRLAPEIKG